MFNKLFIKILSRIAPTFVVNKLYNTLNNPRSRMPSNYRTNVFSFANKEVVEFKGINIQTYHWDGKGPEVMLIHGWEGSALNFEKIINVLVDNDFKVRTFDAPSHGLSEDSKSTMYDFRELVYHMIKKYSIKNLITHSFGAVPSTYLAANKKVFMEKMVLIACPNNFYDWIIDVSSKFGIGKKIVDLTIDKIEKKYDMDINDMSVAEFAKDLKKVKSLIIHGDIDKIIPIEKPLEVYKNWEGSKFLKLKNLGHSKILRSDEAIKSLLNFLKE